MLGLTIKDWVVLGIIGFWLILVGVKLRKGKKSGQCIGCVGRCQQCQYFDTKKKETSIKY